MTKRDAENPALAAYAATRLDDDVQRFLEEDLGSGDLTSEALLSGETARAIIKAKQSGIVVGLEEARYVFEKFRLEVSPLARDGDRVAKGTEVMRVEGKAQSILACERLVLNILMRMSGIATATQGLVKACKKINPSIRIAGTRKTTPGFRYYEKKAILVGGGEPHRWNLSDEILIKDNHLKIVGSIDEAVKRAKKKQPHKKIEVEVVSLDRALEAVNAGADVIMLDNFAPEEAAAAYNEIKKRNPKIIVEVSGGITEENIAAYARHADIISLGALTHSVRAADFSLKIEKVFNAQE